MSDCLRFSVLGPLEVRRDSTPVDVGPNKRRLLLIRLLIEDGHLVSTDRLVEDIWEGGPARLSSLHSHISRLRSALEPTRSPRTRDGVLVSRPRGYALIPPPGSLDAHRFADSVVRARALLQRGHADDARKEAETGLGLWRGQALSDAKGYEFVSQHVRRLEQAHQEAQELRAEAMILQGDLHTAIQAGAALSDAEPLRESGWALLIRALYLAGRAGEALRTFERFRTHLAETLGLDPSPGMRALHLAVLRHDAVALGGPAYAALDPATGETDRTAGSRSRPARRLVGRTRQLTSLTALLEPDTWNRGRFAAVYGGEGMGKTRLVEEFATQAASTGYTVAWGRCAPPLGSPRAPASLGPLMGIQAQLGIEEPDVSRLLDPPIRGRRSTLRLAQQHAVAEVSVHRIARAMSPGPVVCVIEDLHWASRMLLRAISLLAALCRDLPCVLVCTMRESDSPLVTELSGFLAQLGAVLVTLAPLSAADVQGTLTAGGGNGDPRLAESLRSRTDGNPFLLTEVLKLPREQWIGSTAVVPPAVVRVFQARLSRMSPSVSTMLREAAAHGTRLDITELTGSLGVPSEVLRHMSEVAVEAGFLVREADPRAHGGRDGGYRFGVLAREMLLSGALPARHRPPFTADRRAESP